MSSSTNSIAPFLGGSVKDALESIGITQFPSEFEWYQVIGGVIIQGGTVSVGTGAVLTVNLPAPYEKQHLLTLTQVVGAVANTAYVTTVTLSSFDIQNGVGDRTYFWLSLGV